jgi:DNA polymerase III subunit epsilon
LTAIDFQGSCLQEACGARNASGEQQRPRIRGLPGEWGQSYTEGMMPEYVAFDLETTGLSARRDRIVELAAVRFTADGAEIARFQQLVNPECPMPAAARAIHGISDADLAGEPTAAEQLPRLLEFIGDPDSSFLVAHHAVFDAGFLGRELSRAGLNLPAHRVYDTLALSRRCRPDLPSHRLDRLARCHGLLTGPGHRALVDALRVKQLWLKLGGPSLPLDELVSYRIHDPEAPTPAPHGWEILEQAMALGLTVRIEHGSRARGVSPRSITPRRFIYKGGACYLVARCHRSSLEKEFRLDRIRHCELLPVVVSSDGHVACRPPNR